jgi:hypothetical protein
MVDMASLVPTIYLVWYGTVSILYGTLSLVMYINDNYTHKESHFHHLTFFVGMYFFSKNILKLTRSRLLLSFVQVND